MNERSQILGSLRSAAVLAGAAVLGLALCAAPVSAKPGNGNGKGKGGGPTGGGGVSYQPDERTMWRATLAGRSRVRPAVNPVDGTVYVVDSAGNLYAFDPQPDANGDPVLIWSKCVPDELLPTEECPGPALKGVDVPPDGGLVYTGTKSGIFAFDATDGSPVWDFALSGQLSDLKDVAVAPNFQAYVCGIHTDEGVFCLQPSGNPVWAVDYGVSGKFEPNYIEMDFGPGANGSTQIYFQDGDLTRSFAIHEDPPAVFELPKVSGQPPVVSDFDGTWHRGGEAYDSNGDPMWTLAATTPLTTPAIAAGDGTHYTVNQSFRILALTPSGQQDWSRELDEGVRGPAVDPSGAQLLMPIDTIAGNLLLSEGALTEQSLSADVVAAQGLSQTRGLRVAHAPPGSAAARAGLRRGDVIVGYRGKAVESHGGLRRLAAEDDSGAEEQFTVVRQGELQLVSATGKLPAAIRASSAGNGADLWRVELAAPADGSVADVEETGIAFSPSGDMAYVLAYGSAPGLPSTVHLYALATDPSIPNASTQLRSSEVSVRGRKKGRKVSVRGTVTIVDENRAAVGGAEVNVVWSTPSGTETQTATTGSNGEASFSVSNGTGFYELSVVVDADGDGVADGVSKGEYTFDPLHSVLTSGPHPVF